jgi:SAM-dependent methyltransferase
VNDAENDVSLRVTRRGNLTTKDVLTEMQEQARNGLLQDAAAEFATALGASSQTASGEVCLPALLALNGTAFLQAAFNAILHRPPDSNGMTHYAAQLATGERSKIEILGDLRYSVEGRKIGVRIPGLRSRYILLRVQRLGGIGPLVSLLFRVVRWPRQVRRSQVELLNGMTTLRATTDNLQSAMTNLHRHVEQLQVDFSISDSTVHRFCKIEAQLATLSMENWAEPLVALSAQVEEHARRMRLIDIKTRDIEAVAAVLRGLRTEHGWPDEDAVTFAARLADLSRDVIRRAVQADETTQRNRAELLDQSRRLGLLLADVRSRLGQSFAPAELRQLEEADDQRLDSLYVAFEDRFRGSRAEIRARQRTYLPLLREAKAGKEDRPIVDVGAGRGEWLELLGEEGLRVTGVDLNHSMVELCRSFGLDCVQADAIAYLRQLADNSLGAVTGFHIIEHLPFKVFVALLDESLRVLKPDGLILFETPNPANVLVGSRSFYLDPTHRNPMPSEMTGMIVEARGFVHIDIRELHPAAARFHGRDEALAAQLNRLFYGPQDYALVARKA